MGPGQAQSAFARALRRRRQTLRLTLEGVASRVGCAKSYLSAVENGHRSPPSDELLRKIESALSFDAGELVRLAHLDRMPTEIRRDIETLHARDRSARTLARMLSEQAAGGGSLDEMFRSGQLRALIERLGPATGAVESVASALPMEIPVINKVTAGYPAGFTDLDYPARVADEYVRAPDVHDADAFAARVVGDSMSPEYREGDIVVFSPAVEVQGGMDCFVRLEPDHESTFKRVYFETTAAGDEMIRIQPINSSYAATTVPREQVAGLYAGVSVIRPIRPLGTAT
jgi:repressor LexA